MSGKSVCRRDQFSLNFSNKTLEISIKIDEFVSQLRNFQGDSGGPLIIQRVDKRHEIIGVVSWGTFCSFFVATKSSEPIDSISQYSGILFRYWLR